MTPDEAKDDLDVGLWRFILLLLVIGLGMPILAWWLS